MKKETIAKNVSAEIVRLCHSMLDARTLRREILKRLKTVIPFDYVFFSTTDPSTNLFTSSVFDETPTWALFQFLENEFLQEDFNQFHTLLKERRSVGVLSVQTQHRLTASKRYREILKPLALGDEMRGVFVANGACWGTMCLHREQDAPEYIATQARFLARLAPHIADGLRKAMLLAPSSALTELAGPGILVLSENHEVVTMNAVAKHWLVELAQAERGNKEALPHAIVTVLTRLHVVESGAAEISAVTPKISVQTPTGNWLMLYASRLQSPDGHGQIAIMFEVAQSAEIAPLILQAYQLTRREGEVVQLSLQGRSTKEIADTLHISLNTVQDHFKAIFEKVSISSRRELAGSIFTQHYQSHFLSGASLDAAGRFTNLDHQSTRVTTTF